MVEKYGIDLLMLCLGFDVCLNSSSLAYTYSCYAGNSHEQTLMTRECLFVSHVFILLYILIAGSVYFVDDKGRCTRCFTAEGAVKFLLYSEGRDMIVVVTEGLILSQHRVAHDGTTSEVAKVRVMNSKECIYMSLLIQILSVYISQYFP